MLIREAVDVQKESRKPKHRDTDDSIDAVVDRSECCLENFQMPKRAVPKDDTHEAAKVRKIKTKYSGMDRDALGEEFGKLKEADAGTLDAALPILKKEREMRCAVAEVEMEYLERLKRCLVKIQERLDEQKRVILRELNVFIKKHGAKKASELLKKKHAAENKKNKAADAPKNKSVKLDQGWWDSIVRAVRSFSLEVEIPFETKFGARISYNREGLESKPVISYEKGSAGERFEHNKALMEEEIAKVGPQIEELHWTMQIIGIFLQGIQPQPSSHPQDDIVKEHE